MRLFIGIPLAAETERALAAEVNRLQSTRRNPSLPDYRWSARESWHITLQFLGSTTPQQYDCITMRLRALRHSQIRVGIGSIGTFPRAGILFADVELTPGLVKLQQAVTAATSPCGFRPEERPYHPHITLARQKGKQQDKNFRDLQLHGSHAPAFPAFSASSFLLYESTPTPQGSRYDVREQFPLDLA